MFAEYSDLKFLYIDFALMIRKFSINITEQVNLVLLNNGQYFIKDEANKVASLIVEVYEVLPRHIG